MNPFQFTEDCLNQLLVNPKATKQEKNDLIYLQFEFEKQFGNKGYFLVPSSGSSKTENESVKLIALSVSAVLNSAKKVNQFFALTADLNWGLVLPYFHVAGLGVYARAYCSKSLVCTSDWNPETLLSWINENQIHLISLVPTQVFDIVQKQLECPEHVKTVFVGASKLSAELKEKALELKWPIIETYGMTETASMISVKLFDKLQVLPDIVVETENDKLKVKCDSLMTCSIQKTNNQIVIKQPNAGWLLTEDRCEITFIEGKYYLNLLGRDSDFIKINGEGVSLSQLRSVLGLHQDVTLVALPNQRTEHEVVLVVCENVQRDQIKSIINAYNVKVRPFEYIKKFYTVEQFPKTDLGKIQFKILEDLIKGNPYEKI